MLLIFPLAIIDERMTSMVNAKPTAGEVRHINVCHISVHFTPLCYLRLFRTITTCQFDISQEYTNETQEGNKQVVK